MDNERILRWNKLLEQLGKLGADEKTQKEAIILFISNRDWIWEFLLYCDGDKILNELELSTVDKSLIGSIVQIFIIVQFEAALKSKEKDN